MPMHAILLGATVAFLVGLCMLLVRAFAGPTAFDRVLATNAIGTKTVVLLCLFGFLVGRPEFLDTALVYAIVNFVSTLALLKFVQWKRIG